MSRNRNRRPRVPDHVPDLASLPPAPAEDSEPINKGEVIAFIAGILGQDPAEVADVTLICRMNDSLPTTFFWNSSASQPGSGNPDRLKLLFNIFSNGMNLLWQQIQDGEGE